MPNLTIFNNLLDLNKLSTSPMKMPIGFPTTAASRRRKHQQQQLTPTSTIRSVKHHSDSSTLPKMRRPRRISTESQPQSATPAKEAHSQQHNTGSAIAPQRQSSTSSSIPTPTPSLMMKRLPFLRPSQQQYTSSFMTRQTSEGQASSTSATTSQWESTPWDFIKKRNVNQPFNKPATPPPKRLLRKYSGIISPPRTKLKREGSIEACDLTTTNEAGCFRSLPGIADNSFARRKKKMIYDPAQWPCVLVQDYVEQDRLVAQHYLLRTAFGNDFTAPVHSLLSLQNYHHQQQQQQQQQQHCLLDAPASSSVSCHDEGDHQGGPVVLDVGCGLGQWCMEMATTYPKPTFIGVDLLSSFPRDIKPRNCHFLQLDIRALPLPFADQSVDYIYQRDLNWGLDQNEWHPLIKEYFRILKPGGWIELVEADLETKSSFGKECAMNDKRKVTQSASRLNAHPSFSIHICVVLEGFALRNQDPYAARRLPSMLATRGFRRVESRFQSLPLGWESSTDANPSQAIQSQYLFYLRSLGPWLRLAMGISQEKYMDYVDQLPSEWKQAQTYVNWHCATAQKPYEA